MAIALTNLWLAADRQRNAAEVKAAQQFLFATAMMTPPLRRLVTIANAGHPSPDSVRSHTPDQPRAGAVD